jgi:hypothetical protein
MGLAPDTPRRSFRAPAPTASATPRWTSGRSAAPAPRPMTGEQEQGRAEARAAPAVIHLPDLRQPRKKVTRGSENRQRSVPILVRVHPADGARLRADAEAAGMSVAGYLASGRLGSETAPRPRMRRRHVSADMAAFLKAMVEFSRAANLLNQQTRVQNTLALVAQERGAAQLREDVRALARANDELRQQFAVALAAIHGALGDVHEG